MAKLIDIKCPKCSAPVPISADATSVTCRYCGGTSVIDRGAPPARVSTPQTTHAGVATGTRYVLFAATIVMGSIAMSVIGTLRSSGTTSVASVASVAQTIAAGVSGTALHFNDPPMLADVNGDGVLDVLGKIRDYPNEAIAAFDGTNGALLWRGEQLSKDALASGAMRGIAHGQVLAIDALGKVQAFDLRTGNPSWSVLLGEQASKICEGAGVIVVKTSDDVLHGLDPATGKKSEVDPKAPCAPVYSTERDVWPSYRIIGWPDMKKNGLPEMSGVDGLTAHRALVPNGPGPKFMLGQRDKGTAVAMVAAIGDQRKVLWKEIVPGVDPLTTDVNTLGIEAAVQGDKLIVPYTLKDNDAGTRVACFDVNTGRRLWDVQALKKSNNSYGIAVSPERVFVTAWFESAVALSLETGELQYQLGGK